MRPRHAQSAETVRRRLEQGTRDPAQFRSALVEVPARERDDWVDRVLGLGELPDDDPQLPAGCVPYLPCPVDAILAVVEHAAVGPSDVFVDVGSGAGRTAALVHLLTGAGVIGLEIQSRLVVAARELAARLSLSRVAHVEGDATVLARYMTIGSIFFLYCPFSGERLAKVVADLADVARTRTIRVCTVDTPVPPCLWLEPEPAAALNVAVYRSTLCEHPYARAQL